ncbi:MAG: transcription antitermination protein NusB [Bacteroidales bacterium]|nr:transcription antitermination protein NusB [Bacteroidales bacterium]
MVSRRLIRIKAFKVLYAAESSQNASLAWAEKELLHSLDKTLDLYYFFLNVVPSLTRVARERVDIAHSKYLPTQEDLEVSSKFADNALSPILESTPEFQKICKRGGLSWAEHDVFVKRLYASVAESDYFKAYMASECRSLAEDCELFKNIFAEEFEDNELLEDLLEEKSAHWIDDVGYVLNVIISDLDRIARNGRMVFHDVFLKDDDKDFALQLIRTSLTRYDDYIGRVRDNAPNWDPERIVTVDAALVAMGLAEAAGCPTIPIKATINEYVEISKYYSTPQSHVFVNGLLDVIIKNMVASGEIVKEGRGLFEGTTAKTN